MSTGAVVRRAVLFSALEQIAKHHASRDLLVDATKTKVDLSIKGQAVVPRRRWTSIAAPMISRDSSLSSIVFLSLNTKFLRRFSLCPLCLRVSVFPILIILMFDHGALPDMQARFDP